MQKFDYDQIYKELSAKSYDPDCINQIIKCLDIGFESSLQIQQHVSSDVIRKLRNVFTNYYQTQVSETIMKLFIDAANNNYDLTHLVDKKHDMDFVNIVLEDLKEGRDIEFYITSPEQNDLSCKTIYGLKCLYEKNILQEYTKEEQNKIKYLDLGYDDDIENAINGDYINQLIDLQLNDKEGFFDHNHAVQICWLTSKFKNWNEYFKEISAQEKKDIVGIMIPSNRTKDQIELLFEYREYIKDLGFAMLEKLLSAGFPPKFKEIMTINTEYIRNELLMQHIDCDIDFVKFLEDNNIKIGQYYFKGINTINYINAMCNYKDRDLLMKYFKIEIENNDSVDFTDLVEIFNGLENEIEVQYYLSNPAREYPFDNEEKAFIRLILEYNKDFPTDKIDLNNVFYDLKNYVGELACDNIEQLTYFLERNININNLIDCNESFLDAIASYMEDDGLVYIDDLIELQDFIEHEEDVYMIMQMFNKGFYICDENKLYKESMRMSKVFEEIKKYDDFTNDIMNSITDQNDIKNIVDSLKLYIKSSGIKKEIYKTRIKLGRYDSIEKKAENMSEEKLQIILDDYKNNLSPERYFSDKYSIEALKCYSTLNKKNDLPHILNHTDEQIKHITDLMKENEKLSGIRYYKPHYDLEKLKIIDECTSVMYVYNMDLYLDFKSIDDYISDQLYNWFQKVDKEKPSDELKQEFEELKYKILKSALEEPELTDYSKQIIENDLQKLTKQNINLER